MMRRGLRGAAREGMARKPGGDARSGIASPSPSRVLIARARSTRRESTAPVAVQCRVLSICFSRSRTRDGPVCRATADSAGMAQAPCFVPDGPWTVLSEGGITAAEGFVAAGISAGLRASSDRPDLALVHCPDGATAAGVFTQNLMCAAPVTFCKDALRDAPPRGITSVLVNAGQANAATGAAGWQDAVDSANALASALDVPVEGILLESTGVIGQRIKMDQLLSGIPNVAKALSPSAASAELAAVAITTTDLVSKSAALSLEIGGHTVTLGGICKGSGMIHPNMATMLGVITCDADVAPDLWQAMLRDAVAGTFNQISVDGDTSTNDTVVALASGKVPVSIVAPDGPDAAALRAGLQALCEALCKSIAWDGEGANVLVEVAVSGAASDADARAIARSVVSSSLTKSAIFGQDPNWGRIAAAAGYAGPAFDIDRLGLTLGGGGGNEPAFALMADGQPLPFDAAEASAYLKRQKEARGTVHIALALGGGEGEGLAWGCDLSYDYVRINAEYTT